ncbi:hypothetical protein ACFX4N_28740 [Priestia sp. YIM B13551]|uniref:hypothetical protein n=1 Tax=Priestia sp. YIM B13551 TaxID=3366306 RepID=UPI003670E1B0
MQASAVKLYEETETNGDQYTLMPVTSNLDGEYYGEAIVNYALGLMLRLYYQKEKENELESLHDQKWVRVRDLEQFMSEKYIEDERETMEYGILECRVRGYINVDIYDSIRYFNLTEKCMNLDLYKFRS